MSTQIQFNEFNFNSRAIRVIVDQNQEPWFCGNDVCDILGYTNSRKALQDHCKKGGVTKRYTPTKSGDQEMIFINEPNLYRLIIKSRKPEAEPFETWVFEEVLPQIRKTGKYSVQQQKIALPEPAKTYRFEFTERELQQLAWDWFALKNAVEFVAGIANPLDLLGSKHAGQAYGIVSEYGLMLRRHQPLINRLTAEFKVETFGDMNWNRVLPTIRNFGNTARRLSAKR